MSTANGTEREDVVDLIEEAADWIRSMRGPSHYMGVEAIRTSVQRAFHDRLIDALLATIPDVPLSDELIERAEAARKNAFYVRSLIVMVERLAQRLSSHDGECCRLDLRDRNALKDAEKLLRPEASQ